MWFSTPWYVVIHSSFYVLFFSPISTSCYFFMKIEKKKYFSKVFYLAAFSIFFRARAKAPRKQAVTAFLRNLLIFLPFIRPTWQNASRCECGMSLFYFPLASFDIFFPLLSSSARKIYANAYILVLYVRRIVVFRYFFGFFRPKVLTRGEVCSAN